MTPFLEALSAVANSPVVAARDPTADEIALYGTLWKAYHVGTRLWVLVSEVGRGNGRQHRIGVALSMASTLIRASAQPLAKVIS